MGRVLGFMDFMGVAARSLKGKPSVGRGLWIGRAVSMAPVAQTGRIRQFGGRGCMSRLLQRVLAKVLEDWANCLKAAQDLAKYRQVGKLYEMPLPCSSPCRL